MEEPKYYRILKAALRDGSLEYVRDIPKIVPVTVLAQDMRLNYNTISKRLLDPCQFTMTDIRRLADLVKMDEKLLFNWVMKETKRMYHQTNIDL
jgi:hypothetical protein